uniref:Uncharacterized protein n=1 Tax=Mola mola TaxID=94237 RepID=A0A3Q3XET5_MOLML
MDEADGLRLKHSSSEDSVLLASSLAEPINLEDSNYAQLRAELESSAQNLEAESWSLVVDQNYLKSLNKEAVKRQDVIYEFIQTEMHHVRTLKILLQVYMYELRRSSLIDEAKLDRLFPGVEALLNLHHHFLTCLKVRQNESQEEGSPNSYQITQFGDILISQFSGAVGDGMIECYSMFCSHHNESISFYKEQLQNNKKLQILMRKIGQLPVVRRLGIPECFMLVTQRITKYPILVERIIQNTEGDSEEYKYLVQALMLIKDAISQVNNQVSEYEKAARLREIFLRLEPKSQGQLLRKEDLMQGTRTLLHEGTVTWKSSGRHKDIHAVLLSDVVILLQEKDQKLVFATVVMISLQRLIVREVAHEDKAMFLICACTSSMPEMYEIHTSSREERVTWMTLIREAVERYPEEDLYHELTAELLTDEHIKQSLVEKQQILAALYDTVMGQVTPHRGLLLRGDASDLQQGESLLMGAIYEVEYLQNLLFSRIKDPNLFKDDKNRMQEGQLRRVETFGVADGNCATVAMKIIVQQDSQIELQHTFQSKSKQPARHYSSVLLEQEKQRNLEKHKEELANLNKLKAQNREEQQRWEKERERQRIQIEVLESQLQQREEDCRKWEEKLSEEKAELQKQRENYQQGLERLRETTKSVDKDKERLNQEKERLEQLQEKLKKLSLNSGLVNYDEIYCQLNYWSYQSFRGSIINGGGSLTLPSKLHVSPAVSDPKEIPPKVPPRKESISPQPAKPELPIQLISTTNQVHKPAAVQQQIPTKLAALSKAKEKGLKGKISHQRTQSAGSDVDLSILRAKRNTSPERIYQPSTPQDTLRDRVISLLQIHKTRGLVGQTAMPPPVSSQGYRASPVFHGQDKKHIASLESEVQLAAGLSSPAPWSRPANYPLPSRVRRGVQCLIPQ